MAIEDALCSPRNSPRANQNVTERLKNIRHDRNSDCLPQSGIRFGICSCVLILALRQKENLRVTVSAFSFEKYLPVQNKYLQNPLCIDAVKKKKGKRLLYGPTQPHGPTPRHHHGSDRWLQMMSPVKSGYICFTFDPIPHKKRFTSGGIHFTCSSGKEPIERVFLSFISQLDSSGSAQCLSEVYFSNLELFGCNLTHRTEHFPPVGFISHVRPVESPWKTFGKGRGFDKSPERTRCFVSLLCGLMGAGAD